MGEGTACDLCHWGLRCSSLYGHEACAYEGLAWPPRLLHYSGEETICSRECHVVATLSVELPMGPRSVRE
eukprot:1397700-Pyramimonas_sp.AAC.1